MLKQYYNGETVVFLKPNFDDLVLGVYGLFVELISILKKHADSLESALI